MKQRFKTTLNIDRLNSFMDARGIDAVVARAGLNFTYLAGVAYPGTLARHVDLADSPRAVYAVWPRNGEPYIVLNATALDLAKRDAWIEQMEIYEGYVERPVEGLIRALSKMGLAEATVATEKDYVSALDWSLLESRLPKMRLVDSTDLMDQVRAVKVLGEIERFKKGADILDRAFQTVFAKARPGMRERDLHAALVAECIANGSEFTHGILNSSRNIVRYGGESDFVLKAGDAVRTDYVAYVNGYPGHQSRCFVIGEPSTQQKAEYRAVRDLYRGLNDELVPGRTAGAVYDLVVERFTAAGLRYHNFLAGHSVGSWWHQQEPVISRGNPRVLEAGMVIAMEPHVNHWHIQDMLLVKSGGTELISSLFSTDEIFACV
jgi:Xaa-Pro aminopeptidase